MDDPKQKETQSELFEQFSPAPQRSERFPNVSRPQKSILFTTNIEQLLMAGILCILVLCGVFFLGVVRGKALTGGIVEPAPAAEAPAAVQRPVPAPRQAQPAAPAVSPQPAAPVRTQAPAAEVRQPVPDSSSKPYTIQIVTHRKKELAETEMNGLRAAGFYSFIIKSGEYYQVCVGQYASKEEAKKDQARFQAKFKDSFLRRR